MVRSPDEFREAIASGDADRVNDAIDEAEDLVGEGHAQLFEECFDEMIEVYEEGDGYQRLSAVRFLRSVGALELSNEYWEGLWEFYLVALQDDDGRVRNSAASGIHVYVMLMAAENNPVEPLQTDLEEEARNHSGKKQEDIVEVLERVRRVVESPLSDLIGGRSPGPPREWEDML